MTSSAAVPITSTVTSAPPTRAARVEPPAPVPLRRRSVSMDGVRISHRGMQPIPRVSTARHAAANRSDPPSIEADAIRAIPSGARATTASSVTTARPIPATVPTAARISPSATN